MPCAAVVRKSISMVARAAASTSAVRRFSFPLFIFFFLLYFRCVTMPLPQRVCEALQGHQKSRIDHGGMGVPFGARHRHEWGQGSRTCLWFAVFFECSMAVNRGYDGGDLFTIAYPKPNNVVFMDFVSGTEQLMVATRTTAQCMDPVRGEGISEYRRGASLMPFPTGVACEFILFVASANHTTNILLFTTPLGP